MSLDGASILNNFLDVYLERSIGPLDRSVRCIISAYRNDDHGSRSREHAVLINSAILIAIVSPSSRPPMRIGPVHIGLMLVHRHPSISAVVSTYSSITICFNAG
jgi:hypothetical protein